MVFALLACGLAGFAAGQDLFISSSNLFLGTQSSTKITPKLNDSSSCSAYKSQSENCNNCGACKNAGARTGVLCRGKSTGYYCPPDSPDADGDMSFACMDWTFGSVSMRAAETAFNQKYNENVRFGVGTFGSSDDPQRGLGNCYRLEVEGMDKELILQSINTGSDVSGNQFDMQIGAGGAGAFNTCAGGKQPGHDSMYPGSYDTSNWGKIYGGVDHRKQCKNLPGYPFLGKAMKSAGDDLVTLCEYGFDHGARKEGGGNPSIVSIGRVQCPRELVELTQLRRSDDPESHSCGESCMRAPHPCTLDQPGATAAWCLTRMMDCRKPSGAFIDNTQASLTVPGQRIVQTCTSDGYTRQDVQCGCIDCYC